MNRRGKGREGEGTRIEDFLCGGDLLASSRRLMAKHQMSTGHPCGFRWTISGAILSQPNQGEKLMSKCFCKS